MINNLNIEIWGRNYDLRVEYDCYDNETVTDAQLRAVEGLSAHPELISVSKEQVEDFCREQVQQDFENNKKDNVFSYIKPEYLFVKHEKIRAWRLCVNTNTILSTESRLCFLVTEK